MRVSPFSTNNGLIGGLKLICGRNKIPNFLCSSNLVLEFSSSTDDNSFVPEDPISIDENFFLESLVQNRYSSSAEEFFEFVSRDNLAFENWKPVEDNMKIIKRILFNRGWKLGSGNAHRIDLDPFNVTRILNDLFDESNEAALVFYFYKWCEICTRMKHTIHSICTMIHILVVGNMNHRAVDLISYLVRNNDGEEWQNLIYNVLAETRKDKMASEIIYSMLLSSYVKENMINMAIKLFYQLHLVNIFPTIMVCNRLIRSLLESKEMDLAWEVFGEMQSRGMGLNASIMSLFIQAYCAECNLISACTLLVKIQNYGLKPDVVAYTIVIDALCKMGNLKEATSAFFKMTQIGIRPDSVSVTVIFVGYCKAGRLDEAIDILKIFSLHPNIYVYNSILSKLCQDGNMVKAVKLFHHFSVMGIFPDCCCYTTIIGGYCKVSDIDKALQYLGEMLKRGFKPNTITYTILINTSCKIGDIEIAESMLRMMAKEGMRPDLVLYNTIIDGYGKRGLLRKAFELLDMMRSADILPDITTYNILIHGLVKSGFVKESRDIVDELIRREFSPDVLTFTNVIDGFSKEGSFEEAFLVWSYMSAHGIRPDVVTCSALLNGYCKAHRMEEATTLFHKMLDTGLNPDLILYNTLINGFSRVGNMHDACSLLSMMAERGIVPNNSTYNTLVRGFEKLRVKNPEETVAVMISQTLLKYGIDVDISQFVTSH